MKVDGLIFDFDGVLVDSEAIGNRHLADYLTGIGHPTSPKDAMAHFMGLSGKSFIDAIETRIGQTLGEDFYEARRIEDDRVMREGIDAIAGGWQFAGINTITSGSGPALLAVKTARRNVSADSSTVSSELGKIVWICPFGTPRARRSRAFWAK